MITLVCIPRNRLACLLLFWFACGTGCRKEPTQKQAARESAAAASAPAPSIAVEPNRVDFGLVTVNEEQSRIAQVTNRGTVPLRLRAETASSACTATMSSLELMPQATHTMHLTCRFVFQGQARESIALVSAETSSALSTVVAEARVQPQLGFEPNLVEFNLNLGEKQTQIVRLFGERAKDNALVIRETGSPFVTAHMRRATSNGDHEIELRCIAEKVGMHAGSVVLWDGRRASKAGGQEFALPWACRVPGTLTVEPTNPYFNLRASGEKATIVTVTSRQPGFKLFSARVIEGPFVAFVEPGSQGGPYRISIRVLTQKLADDARSASGLLLIQSNDRTEPRKEVPLFGFGHVNKVERAE